LAEDVRAIRLRTILGKFYLIGDCRFYTKELSLVEEKTAKELKKLLGELVDHSHGHHKAIHGLSKRVSDLERRIRALEQKAKR
jgi:polyhydroxyalkanoate synthesis regulator phasin